MRQYSSQIGFGIEIKLKIRLNSKEFKEMPISGRVFKPCAMLGGAFIQYLPLAVFVTSASFLKMSFTVQFTFAIVCRACLNDSDTFCLDETETIDIVFFLVRL